MFVKEVELVPCALLLRRHACRGRFAKLQRPGHVVWKSSRHVGVNTDQFRRCLQRHLFRDGIAPIAALCDEALVTEALHQYGPGARDALGVPPRRRRLA